MNIRRVLAVTAIPVLLGTVGLAGLKQAHAAQPSLQLAQAQATEPNQSPDGQRRPQKIDFAAAATKLGVTEAHLKAALGIPAKPPGESGSTQRPPRPNFKAAAAKLGLQNRRLKRR